MLRTASLIALTSVMAASGCATTYTPRPGPRLSVVMEDGKPGYMRDGQFFEAGMFGSGLVDAVEGVPEAEEHARSFHNRNVSGFAATLAGVGMVVGGAVVTAHGFEAHRADRQQLGVGLLIGGIALELIGALVVASAPPHQLDAINIYNDTVEARQKSVTTAALSEESASAE